MSEHITALNLVLNVVQPKFSSLLRRVSKVLKFAKSFIKFVNSFYSKGRQGDSSYEAVPLSPFLNPPNPSHVQGACNGAKAPHVFCYQVSFRKF